MSNEDGHQVIIGALNSGENSFSLGGVDGLSFVTCGIGADIVVLTLSLERIQIILGTTSETVACVNCCRESGKIAASYGDTVKIFEPVLQANENIHPYRWVEIQVIQWNHFIENVQWALRGLRLLVLSRDELILYQHKHLSTVVSNRPATTVNQNSVKFMLSDEEVSWENVWTCKLAARVKYAKFSPDGSLFATCGENDKLIKIWYQLKDSTSFSFIYLQHPAPVCGFEWRLCGRYMKYVQNAIISWCEDNTSRIWKEIPSRDSAHELIVDAAELAISGKNNIERVIHRHAHLRRAKKRLLVKLTSIMKKKKTARSLLNFNNNLTTLGRSLTIADFAMHASTNALIFALAGTINAENDCYLVPSMLPRSKKPFTVHWLNNKEIFFTNASEKILAETIIMEQRSGSAKPNTFAASTSSVDITEHNDKLVKESCAASTPVLCQHDSSQNSSTRVSDVSTRDILDYKLEGFLREWNKSFDVLFSIHPVDGSLLTWIVEWLDDSWKQANISFSSRFPEAFPLTDASSIYSTLCVFDAHESKLSQMPRRSNSADSTYGHAEKFLDDFASRANNISMLTNHENGSLNLWQLSLDEQRNFSTVLSVSHRRRMCGHRFHISKVVAHPTLPLLLTASRFSPPNRNSAVGISDKAMESELILWATSPVAPLCKSGGLRELSRITANSAHSFSFISWIPIIIPSFAMGPDCNSPSSCFIISNNGMLSLYQAVVDARGVLSQIHRSEKLQSEESNLVNGDSGNPYHLPTLDDKSNKNPYDVVSSQSSARPGCILHIADIQDSQHSSNEVLFLHVFVEDFATTADEYSSSNKTNAAFNAERDFTFLEKYLVVMIIRSETEDYLQIWSLTIQSEAASTTEPTKNNNVLLAGDDQQTQDSTLNRSQSQFAKLRAETEKVYDQRLSFGEGVRINTCATAIDHLPSATLYPSCKTPYTFVAACSDDKLRFLRCIAMNNGLDKTYSIISWKMVNQSSDSSLEMDGDVCNVSSAYSGRFACVYHLADVDRAITMPSAAQTTFANYVSDIVHNMELAIFECESSGGVEWVREDTFSLKKILDSIGGCDSNSDIIVSDTKTPRQLVRIDWVSTEDGSHILTVGIGDLILFFVQVSQNTAQTNIAKLKENENIHGKNPLLRKSSSLVNTGKSSSRLIRWMCIRTLRLWSADGMPPLPTAMSWVRDGLLIVGMNSEMRVYNQWNLSTKIHNIVSEKKTTAQERSAHGKSSAKNEIISISRSHSILDQIDRAPADRVASSRLLKELMSNVISSSRMHQELKDDGISNAISDEGLFEASRLSNPMLPQYHPKQLIELLNAGKTKRVKSILLHVLHTLKHRHVSLSNPLSRAASFRRMRPTMDAGSFDGDPELSSQRRQSLMPPVEDTAPDYDELDTISPLPLYALFAADKALTYNVTTENGGLTSGQNYDSLFNDIESDEDLDEVLDGIRNDDDVSQHSTRTRHSSGGSERAHPSSVAAANFTTRHSRALTELLTHTHLPGLSSVDQMHLLAVADTISHFSSNIMDKLTHVNAALKPAVVSTLGDSAATGYASATMGTETVDECGLRFLMAMKQHEYLLLCLPPTQRKLLKARGISMAHVIWAFHSVTETELLSAIPCCQKSQEIWEELRAFGVAWWLKNTSTLRICVEKMAKCSFQQNQDPMDASLFYLALRKKNVLMHLFKTVNNTRMYDFFREDFSEEKWKRAALKNAFALMSKQRFQHAAAFFLLGGSLKDAVQTILSRLKDIQLAMVVIRLYETDVEEQSRLMTSLLCREVLGCTEDEIRKAQKEEINFAFFERSSNDPFERSMACWLIKEYALSASTLVEEASRDHIFDTKQSGTSEHSLSDIFNFYSYLRRHPLVVRQRLANVGENVVSTEKFLAYAKALENHVTPSERRLYFRTAFAHIALGCPLLALDVLSRLPKQLTLADDGNTPSLLRLIEANTTNNMTHKEESLQRVENMDWSAPTKVDVEDKLELEWSADEENEDKCDEKLDAVNGDRKTSTHHKESIVMPLTDVESADDENTSNNGSPKVVDFISQHLKYVAVLRIMMDELSTLASGFEINGGQLRFEFFNWLENECEILHDICDFQSIPSIDVKMDTENFDGTFADSAVYKAQNDEYIPLHESLRIDRLNFHQQLRNTVRRRQWLRGHEKLLRILASYCALHSAQNYRLTSIQMEILLLLLEIQNNSGVTQLFSCDPTSNVQTFPLLVSALNTCRMFVLSPLQFIRNQSDDILHTIIEFREPPTIEDNFSKVFVIYSLCQGLSSCLYQSLSDLFNYHLHTGASTKKSSGVLNANFFYNVPASADNLTVQTSASKWPGVESFIALLNREKDEDTPNLRLLLVEFFVSIVMSLFSYALTIYDARWLFRLSAHQLNERAFATMFGGCGRKKLRSAVPTRPPPPNVEDKDGASASTDFGADSAAIRAKLHAKVFGAEITRVLPKAPVTAASEQVISCWVPPSKHVVQFFAEKVTDEEAGNMPPSCSYDSETESQDASDDEDYDDVEDDGSYRGDAFTGSQSQMDTYVNPKTRIQSYAWLLLRLACVMHLRHQIQKFITLAGFDVKEIATVSTHLNSVLQLLGEWSVRLEHALDTFVGGRPENLLRNLYVGQTAATVQQAPLLRKYGTLLESGNTPFEANTRVAGCARRLWNFLIRQEHLSQYFIKHVFGRSESTDDAVETSTLVGTAAAGTPTSEHNTQLDSISEAMKIIHRENEPIMAFACNSMRPGNIAISTGREIQEIDIEKILENRSILNEHGDAFGSSAGGGFLNNRVELDIAMQSMQRDMLRDNDDYQLITPITGSVHARHRGHHHRHHHLHHDSGATGGNAVNGSSAIKLCKRPIAGVRRLESHSTLPYYVSGSSDGSILLWEWGVDQPLFTARVAGQYAKVSKLAFAQNSNKFAAVDGDGLLCIWQASQYCSTRRPFFSQRCHSKTVTDVKFLGQTSSLLVTAGHSTGDQNVVLWDTLLPQNKAMVHSFVGQHQEGATCVLFLANSQSILSGGRHGEICVWDLRQCQLRTAFKAFDNGAVRCMCVDPNSDIFVTGSSEGDIKIWSTDLQPQLLHTLSCEHVARSGFTLRKLGGTSNVQGVQQVFVDAHQRLFSCGADSSLKFRNLPLHFV